MKKNAALPDKKRTMINSWISIMCILLTLCNMFFLGYQIWNQAVNVTQNSSNSGNGNGIVPDRIEYKEDEEQPPTTSEQATDPTVSKASFTFPFDRGAEELLVCTDRNWCDVPMPTESHYRFLPPPTDAKRWKKAQIQAAAGEQVLLREVIKHFPNQFNFINGDRSFRNLQPLVDVFLNEVTHFQPLQSGADLEGAKTDERFQQKYAAMVANMAKKSGRPTDPGEPSVQELVSNVPLPYDFRSADRAPIVEFGFPVFQREKNFFQGKFIGGWYLSFAKIFETWGKEKDKIDTPFIGLSALNENWGFLSTVFPGRTANWSVCRAEKFPHLGKLLKEFLDHPKTLMLMVAQHHNQSHPKILTLPRGLPFEFQQTEIIVWDAMRYAVANIKRSTLLFASASSWGPRPRILRCVSKLIPQKFFEGHVDGPKNTYDKVRTLHTRSKYYHKLGRSMFGLAMPGLGYDCFRTWELLTMGSIVVIERSIGMDRTFWRLPVLLLDDFSVLNELMLRQAYLEALYYHKEFEFERLTQSFWWSVVANVSSTKSSQVLLDKFPMEAEVSDFRRPFVRYACAATGTCGKGTFRIPKEEC